jgi:hypothetical protein
MSRTLRPGVRMRWPYALLFLLGAWLLASCAQAEVFRYRDSKGGTLFTDRPLFDRRYTLVWRSSVGKIEGASRRVHLGSGKASVRNNWQEKKKYVPLIKSVARKTRLSPELLHAVVQAESAYDPRARSSAGAMGLMQLMPGTAQRYGVSNVWDPVQNLEGGARYLRDLLDMFENNLRLALAAYNAGEGAVKKYGNRIPPYPETRNYVRKVIDFYRSERQQRNS